MRLGGNAAYLTEVHDRRELQEALEWASQNRLPVMMIGGGSNIIWKDEGFGGLIMVNKIMRYEEQPVDDENFYVHIGAGENWDEVVARVTAKGMTGIEALSLIPGTAGATPVQNVGAYGQEIANTLVSVEAYDNQAKQFVTIPGMDCAFGYRTSRFKTTDPASAACQSAAAVLPRAAKLPRRARVDQSHAASYPRCNHRHPQRQTARPRASSQQRLVLCQPCY